MLDIPSISGIVAAIGVIIGVVFALLEVRNLVKTRQTDALMRMYSTFGSKEYQEVWTKTMTMEFKDYNDFEKKYGPPASENPAHTAIIMVGMYFEGIGVLLYRKLIDISLVDDLLSTAIKVSWEKTKPIIEGYRKHFDRPQIYEWFEYLYSEIEKREQQLASKTA